MGLAEKVRQKCLDRLNALIEEGEAISKGGRAVKGRPRVSSLETGQVLCRSPGYVAVDGVALEAWKQKCIDVLSQVISRDHPSFRLIKDLQRRQWPSASQQQLNVMVGRIGAVCDGLESGFFDDLSAVVRAEMVGDYMAQAEALMAEGYHVPAAVLAGAVLEDALRKLCDEKSIPTSKPNGERKTVNPMNDDLAKAKVYNAAQAHEIRAWASIRNDCAHGDGGKVKPDDVGRMVQGVCSFVADYLR